jgi:hypothetical protein
MREFRRPNDLGALEKGQPAHERMRIRKRTIAS